MRPIDERGHDHDQGDDDDDDDGMPPLVDNPSSQSMTYTFYSGMTPASFSSSSPTVATLQHQSEPQLTHTPKMPQPPPEQPTASSSSSSVVAPARGSHGKKRDASYIPRPPNAFILYRSSFIKSQQVTEKVEGNHSNLSKIIGKYWKTLPQAERDEWEAKAVLAQAEHRARYPDWRFRPGANALAKLRAGANADAKAKGGGTTRSRASTRDKGKAKETAKEKKGKGKERIDAGSVGADVDADVGGGSGPSKRRRVNPQAKDPPRTRSNSGLGLDVEEEDDRGGGGNGDDDTYEPPTDEPKRKRGRGASVAVPTTTPGADTRKTAMETRCAKIADLLVEGKTGVALEVAVKEWEGGRKRKAKSQETQIGSETDTGDTSRKETQTEATNFEGNEAEAQARSTTFTTQTGDSSTSNIGPLANKPPHLLIPPQYRSQPSPASSLQMLSPTRSPASSYAQPASPYTQTTASPYAPASPYIQPPPSPYIRSAPAYPQHSRSQSLYGRFPGHEAGPTSASHVSPPPIHSSHSQSNPPSYTRASRSSPGETRPGTQDTRRDARDTHPRQDDADPGVQDPPRPLDLATYTSEALARGTPLTQLFKRSLSAPASENRLAYPPVPAQDIDSVGDAATGAGDPERGRHPGRVGDGPVESSRGTMNPSFSFGGGGYPPLPSSHLYQERRPSANPHGYPPFDPPPFSQAHPRHATYESQSQPHLQSHSRPEDRQREVRHQHRVDGANVAVSSPLDPPPLTWMDEEQRRRLEAATEHGYWWNGDEEDDGATDADAEGDIDEAVGEEGLGYNDASNEEFDVAYSHHYSGSGSYARNDGREGWTSVAGRHGLISALEDPYLRRKSRSRSTTPPNKTHPLPPPTPIPAGEIPLSDALIPTDQYQHQPHPLLPPSTQHQLELQDRSTNDYYSSYHHPPISPLTPLPQSSFSTLAGWDGGSVSQASKWMSGSGWESGGWGAATGIENRGSEMGRGRGLNRDGRKVMFAAVAEEDEGVYGYRMGEMGMGAEMGGVDRGMGMLYDDEDDGGNDMVVGSPPSGQ